MKQSSKMVAMFALIGLFSLGHSALSEDIKVIKGPKGVQPELEPIGLPAGARKDKILAIEKEIAAIIARNIARFTPAGGISCSVQCPCSSRRAAISCSGKTAFGPAPTCELIRSESGKYCVGVKCGDGNRTQSYYCVANKEKD